MGIGRVDQRLPKLGPQASTSFHLSRALPARICVLRAGKQLWGYKLSLVSVLSSVEGGGSPEYMKSRVGICCQGPKPQTHEVLAKPPSL